MDKNETVLLRQPINPLALAQRAFFHQLSEEDDEAAIWWQNANEALRSLTTEQIMSLAESLGHFPGHVTLFMNDCRCAKILLLRYSLMLKLTKTASILSRNTTNFLQSPDPLAMAELSTLSLSSGDSSSALIMHEEALALSASNVYSDAIRLQVIGQIAMNLTTIADAKEQAFLQLEQYWLLAQQHLVYDENIAIKFGKFLLARKNFDLASTVFQRLTESHAV